MSFCCKLRVGLYLLCITCNTCNIQRSCILYCYPSSSSCVCLSTVLAVRCGVLRCSECVSLCRVRGEAVWPRAVGGAVGCLEALNSCCNSQPPEPHHQQQPQQQQQQQQQEEEVYGGGGGVSLLHLLPLWPQCGTASQPCPAQAERTAEQSSSAVRRRSQEEGPGWIASRIPAAPPRPSPLANRCPSAQQSSTSPLQLPPPLPPE